MPLLDHFHPPLSERRHWEAFHARWASALADDLNQQGLPEHLFAEPTVHIGGSVEVDVATLEESAEKSAHGGTPIATLPQTSVSAPSWVIPAVFSDSFEVQVINTEGGPKLVAAIELVSPSNKDRPQTRRAFAVKCANYLCQGIPFIMIDVVTSRLANLHNEVMDLLQAANFRLPAEQTLYATAYRPVRREKREEIDAWHAALAVGSRLPSLPLFLGGDLSIVVDFEASYLETCQRLRLVA
ncbi:MAG: DUF4058 family protein [Gemmataceae bacterium]|nr:DUF4058 family protein [Gemmataceae bacterium]MCI0739724.1 DUF4058 family protein [Gemmataceae bacterium]